LTVNYCDVQNGIDSIYVTPLSTLNWGVGNIDDDPLFVGTGDHPFSLQTGSPCIDAGTPDISGFNLPEDDLAGNPRVFGGIIDIGAYEWQGTQVDEEFVMRNWGLGNYPNPFNPETTIYFETTNLHENSRIEIFNLKGQKVKSLPVILSPESSLGKGSVIWNGRDENNIPVGSGIYFYKLKVGDFQKVRKMILMK